MPILPELDQEASNITYEEVLDYLTMYNELTDGTVDAMIITDSSISLLEDQHSDIRRARSRRSLLMNGKTLPSTPRRPTRICEPNRSSSIWAAWMKEPTRASTVKLRRQHPAAGQSEGQQDHDHLHPT